MSPRSGLAVSELHPRTSLWSVVALPELHPRPAPRSILAVFDRQAITDHIDAADRIEPTLANVPIDRADANDPIDPTESAEPVEPMDRTEFFDQRLSTEFSDPIDQRDPRLSRMRPSWRTCRLAGVARDEGRKLIASNKKA